MRYLEHVSLASILREMRSMFTTTGLVSWTLIERNVLPGTTPADCAWCHHIYSYQAISWRFPRFYTHPLRVQNCLNITQHCPALASMVGSARLPGNAIGSIHHYEHSRHGVPRFARTGNTFTSFQGRPHPHTNFSLAQKHTKRSPIAFGRLQVTS